MIEYVTVSDVDTALGSDWANGADKDSAVFQANTHLNTYTFKAWESQPDAVTRAGAELARESAEGRLYADGTAAVKRKKVRAGDVESETEWVGGNTPESGAMTFINALLAPWITVSSAVQFLRRI